MLKGEGNGAKGQKVLRGLRPVKPSLTWRGESEEE